MKNNVIFLHHILKRCEKIEEIISTHTIEDIFVNEDLQDIIIRSFEIIGEATTHISDDFKDCHSEIPWGKIKGMRNVMIHQYFRIDMDFVWSISTTNIPELREQIESILKSSL